MTLSITDAIVLVMTVVDRPATCSRRTAVVWIPMARAPNAMKAYTAAPVAAAHLVPLHGDLYQVAGAAGALRPLGIRGDEADRPGQRAVPLVVVGIQLDPRREPEP